MVGWIVNSDINIVLARSCMKIIITHWAVIVLLPQMVSELLIHVPKKTHHSSNGCHRMEYHQVHTIRQSVGLKCMSIRKGPV